MGHKNFERELGSRGDGTQTSDAIDEQVFTRAFELWYSFLLQMFYFSFT